MKLRQKEIKLLTHNHREIYGTVLNHSFLWPGVLPQWGRRYPAGNNTQTYPKNIKKKKKKILKEFPERRETNRLMFIESLQYACQAISQAPCIHVLFNLSNSRY